jgi:hypothetical protein
MVDNHQILDGSWKCSLPGDGWTGDLNRHEQGVSALAVKSFNQTRLSLFAMYTFHDYLLLKALHKNAGIYTSTRGTIVLICFEVSRCALNLVNPASMGSNWLPRILMESL